MLAQFSIWALDDPHLRDEMQTIHEVLDSRGVNYEMDRMATTLEGSFQEITSAVAACQAQLSKSHQRLLINITIDDDRV